MITNKGIVIAKNRIDKKPKTVVKEEEEDDDDKDEDNDEDEDVAFLPVIDGVGISDEDGGRR